MPLRAHSRFCFGWSVAWLSTGGAAVAATLLASRLSGLGAPVGSETTAKYLVVLEGEPAAAAFIRAESQQAKGAGLAAGHARAEELHAQHEVFAKHLHDLGVTELGRFSKLVNAVWVRATPTQAEALRSLPGVLRVQPVQAYRPSTGSSIPFIGTPNVWGGTPQADGTNIRIGIIDSGIDYTHADFGGSGLVSDYTSNNRTNIQPGTFPTAKVVGGWDFVGDNYDESNPTNNTPHPDPNPLDCGGHGSHVAGIAAGFGVLTNGLTYPGPYTNGMDFSQFTVGPGVAPEAKLYALKVFGCSGSVGDDVLVQALEWAADPTGTTNFMNHLDVVNLSLGSPFGLTGPGNPVHDAVNLLADLGCVPVIAAGNNGETFYIVGSPATSEKALTVASSIDDGTTTFFIQILSPGSVATNMNAVEGAITKPLAQTGPIQADAYWTQPNNACSTIMNGLDMVGHIALIDRGSCTFVSKIQQAQNAGAIGVIMVNNVPGPPIIMSGTTSNFNIPGVMISQADGNLLRSVIPGVRMSADNLQTHPELADQLTGFSSRGPAAPVSLLKPEIAAPGFNIISAKVGSGTNGVQMSGTSMSAPHVAGAAALLKQLHPDWSAEEIKAVLMNTARATRDASGNMYPESRAGAGRVQVDDAARAPVTAKAENSSGLVSLSFGALELTNIYTTTSNVVLSNHSAADVSYVIAVSNTVPRNGVTLTSLLSSVTVPASNLAVVPMQFTANPLLFDRTVDPTTTNLIGSTPRQVLYEASGEVWFLNTNLSIHLPYYANVRAASAFRAGATNFTLPVTNSPLPVGVTLAGWSAQPQPLVSAFQLGVINTNRGLTNAESAANVLAVGAASDAATQTQFANSTVYFGLAAAGNWATPQREFAEFDIEIDTNNDGSADLVVFNWSLANSLGAESDAFETGLFIEPNGPRPLNSFVDFYNAAQRDTAPFNNSVLVLPVTVSALGLGPGHSQFRYRVSAYWNVRPSSLVDQTGWVTFDAARPVLDTATFGVGGRPFFADGSNVVVRADQGAGAGNGFVPLNQAGLLLLHHFNTSGSRFEVINLQFAPQFFRPILNPDGSLALSWSGAPSATYTLQYATNLGQGFVFQAASGLAATPPMNTFTVTNPASPTAFYRLVQQ